MYGEDSVKLGKTYKIIGTLHIITENPEEAKQYLLQAYKIFEAKGMEKLMKEVSSKLKLVNSPKKADIKIREEEKALIGEEGKSKNSGTPSPDRDATIPGKSLKIGSAALPKGKKGKKKASTKLQH